MNFRQKLNLTQAGMLLSTLALLLVILELNGCAPATTAPQEKHRPSLNDYRALTLHDAPEEVIAWSRDMLTSAMFAWADNRIEDGAGWFMLGIQTLAQLKHTHSWTSRQLTDCWLDLLDSALEPYADDAQASQRIAKAMMTSAVVLF